MTFEVVSSGPSSAPLPPANRFSVKDVACKNKRSKRKITKLAGLQNVRNYVVYGNDRDTAQKAVLERIFYVKDDTGAFVAPPRPIWGTMFVDLLGEFRERVIDEVLANGGTSVPLSDKERVAAAPPATQRRVERALKRLQGEVPQEEECQPFPKSEKLEEGKTPRIVTPRPDGIAAYFGKFILPIEKRIYTAIDRVFAEPTVFKGYNVLEMGRLMRNKWLKYVTPVAIGFDAKRFDQHISVAALRYVHTFYLPLFEGEDRANLARILEYQIRTRAKIIGDDYIITYNLEGGRCSGDMDTSLGNGIIMCALMWFFFKRLGIDCSLANNGDDCVVFTESCNIELINTEYSRFFLEFGFTMKMEQPALVFEHLEFCQMKPVLRSDEQYVMVRSPMTVIAKDHYMLYGPPSNYRKWLYCVARGGQALTDGVPVLAQFYSSLLRHATSPKTKSADPFNFHRSGTYYYSLGLERQDIAITTRTRLSFYEAFGIDPYTQIRLENALSTLILCSPGQGINYHSFSTLSDIIYAET